MMICRSRTAQLISSSRYTAKRTARGFMVDTDGNVLQYRSVIHTIAKVRSGVSAVGTAVCGNQDIEKNTRDAKPKASFRVAVAAKINLITKAGGSMHTARRRARRQPDSGHLWVTWRRIRQPEGCLDLAARHHSGQSSRVEADGDRVAGRLIRMGRNKKA